MPTDPPDESTEKVDDTNPGAREALADLLAQALEDDSE